MTAYCVPGTIGAWDIAVNKIAKILVLKELIFYCRPIDKYNVMLGAVCGGWGEAEQGEADRE